MCNHKTCNREKKCRDAGFQLFLSDLISNTYKQIKQNANHCQGHS